MEKMIIKETEKAVAFNAIFMVPGGHEELLTWVPKARLPADAIVDGKLHGDREAFVSAAQQRAEYLNGRGPGRGAGYYERHRWAKGERYEFASLLSLAEYEAEEAVRSRAG